MSSESSSPSLKHELRTPLNQIIGDAVLLLEDASWRNSRRTAMPTCRSLNAAARMQDEAAPGTLCVGAAT